MTGKRHHGKNRTREPDQHVHDSQRHKGAGGGEDSPEGKGIIFPDGHVEEHEPVVDSVIRETQEDTGLTIENPGLCGIKE